MKIDVFTHVQLEKYKKAIYKYSDRFVTDKNVQDRRPTLTDQNMRLQLMEKYDDYVDTSIALDKKSNELDALIYEIKYKN